MENVEEEEIMTFLDHLLCFTFGELDEHVPKANLHFLCKQQRGDF